MRKNRVIVRCKSCGKDFETWPCRLKDGQGKYCSKSCQNLSQIGKCKYWLGKKRPNLVKTGAVKTMFKKGLKPWNTGLKGFGAQEKNGNWKGGRYLAKDRGYMLVDFDGKHHLEHRVVMEKHLRRKLGKGEVVHHINHNRSDNRIENLAVMSSLEHSRLHLTPEVSRMGGYACKGIPKRKKVMSL